jgi:hypothetical protein
MAVVCRPKPYTQGIEVTHAIEMARAEFDLCAHFATAWAGEPMQRRLRGTYTA